MGGARKRYAIPKGSIGGWPPCPPPPHLFPFAFFFSCLRANRTHIIVWQIENEPTGPPVKYSRSHSVRFFVLFWVHDDRAAKGICILTINSEVKIHFLINENLGENWRREERPRQTMTNRSVCVDSWIPFLQHLIVQPKGLSFFSFSSSMVSISRIFNDQFDPQVAAVRESRWPLSFSPPRVHTSAEIKIDDRSRQRIFERAEEP